MTFFLAMQSAFFSPAKFGYIKELVGRDLITKANAYVQSVTIGAILSGVFFYSVLFEYWVPSYQTELNMIISNLAGIGIILVFFALIQLGISLFLPLKREVDSLLRFDFKKYVSASYLKTNLFSLYTHKIIWVSSLGLMLFWAVNQVVFATFGAYLKEVSGVTNTVVAQGLLAVSGVGVVLGSIIAGYVSRKGIKLILIPIAAIGMSIGLFFLPMCQSVYIIGCLFFCYGVFGGLFVVTLESLIQLNTGEYSSGQILAGKNFIANVGMLVFLMITVCFSINNYSSVILFNSMCFVAVVGALFTIISYFKSSN